MVRHRPKEKVSIYYARIGYTSTPETRQIIPAGGNHPLKFPRDEQRDPWGMHPKRLPDGTVIGEFLADANSALFYPARTGLAVIQTDVDWQAGQYSRRNGLAGDNQPYEPTFQSDQDSTTWTTMIRVDEGEPFAILVGHTANTPQNIAAARIRIAIHDDVAEPTEQRLRIRPGDIVNDPETEGPPNAGDGIEQPPYDPEPDIP